MTTTQENIRHLREQYNFSQDDMAEKLGMSKNGYGKIERGQSDLNLSRLEQIAKIFNVDISEVVKNKEMVLIGENRDVVQNNYGANTGEEIEKLNLIIQHQQEKIDDLKQLIAQKDEVITLLRKLTEKETTDLIEL